jgi:hypothetical protein
LDAVESSYSSLIITVTLSSFEPFVPEPSASEVEVAVGKLKKY